MTYVVHTRRSHPSTTVGVSYDTLGAFAIGRIMGGPGYAHQGKLSLGQGVVTTLHNYAGRGCAGCAIAGHRIFNSDVEAEAAWLRADRYYLLSDVLQYCI